MRDLEATPIICYEVIAASTGGRQTFLLFMRPQRQTVFGEGMPAPERPISPGRVDLDGPAAVPAARLGRGVATAEG